MPQTPHAPTDAQTARDPGAAADQAALIDELMTQPIKGRPQITVVGDDAVFGINPLPRPPGKP